MKFIRTPEYQEKLFLCAFDEERKVYQDTKIRIMHDYTKRKLRAFCPETDTWLQFPNDLRRTGSEYIADVVEMTQKGKSTFYRVFKGSIRKPGSDVVVG